MAKGIEVSRKKVLSSFQISANFDVVGLDSNSDFVCKTFAWAEFCFSGGRLPSVCSGQDYTCFGSSNSGILLAFYIQTVHKPTEQKFL